MKKTYIIRVTSLFRGNIEFELTTPYDINEFVKLFLGEKEYVTEIIEK